MVNESDDDVSEGEFVPSSWDQSLQPTRSSLKSPDKSTEVRKSTTLLNLVNLIN